MPTGHIEHPELATSVLDADFPDAASHAGHGFAVQRRPAQLQQIELTANAYTGTSRKFSRDVEGVAVPVNGLEWLSRHSELY